MRDRDRGHSHGHDGYKIESECGRHDRSSAAAGSANAALARMGRLAVRGRTVICGAGLVRRGGMLPTHGAIVMMARRLGRCFEHFDCGAMMSRPACRHGMDGVALQRQCHCKHPRQNHAQDLAHSLSLDQSTDPGSEFVTAIGGHAAQRAVFACAMNCRRRRRGSGRRRRRELRIAQAGQDRAGGVAASVVERSAGASSSGA